MTKSARESSWDDDHSLVKQLLAGEESAFEQFFDRYSAGLFRFAVARLGHDEGAAEDVVQATLGRAFSKLATYRGEAALFTWLCTFCRHEISAHYERRRRSPPETPLHEDTPEVRAALESIVAGLDGPDDQLARREVARLVQATLDCLPDRYGDALEWKYIQELSVRELAARLDVTPKAAESLLARAREAFRDAFATLHVGPEARRA